MSWREKPCKANYGRGPECRCCCQGDIECLSYQTAPLVWESKCFLEWEERPDTVAWFQGMMQKANETFYQLKLQRFKEGNLRWYEKGWRPNE